MNSPSPTRQARHELIDAGGRTAASFGVNKLLGQLFVVLYLAPRPLCLDELAEELGVSKASISLATRQLAGWGAIRRVWRKGDRRDFYEAEEDPRQILRNGVLDALQRKLDSAGRQFQEAIRTFEAAAKGRTDGDEAILLDRLRHAEATRAKVSGLLQHPLVRRMI